MDAENEDALELLMRGGLRNIIKQDVGGANAAFNAMRAAG
jgi:hypothetical protein